MLRHDGRMQVKRKHTEQFQLLPDGTEVWSDGSVCSPSCNRAGAQNKANGPMHYVQNTVYHAGDRDHNGHRAGEPSAWKYGVRFNGVPVTHRVSKQLIKFLQERAGNGEFQVYPIAHENQAGETYQFAPKYNLVGYPATKWHECPFGDKTEAEEFCTALNTCTVEYVTVATAWSNGKSRDLKAARSSAIWEDATDAELSVEPAELRQALEARLPRLLEEFHAFIVGLDMVY